MIAARNVLLVSVFAICAKAEVIVIESPMAPPDWALAERALIKENAIAAAEFAAKYIDPRGHFRGVERWGGNDGPDDVMETFPQLAARVLRSGPTIGILEAYERIWEGHLDQFQRAKAPSVEMAREGMYWREFITAFDWEHNGEGLAAFYHYGLCRPRNGMYRQRALRYAGFYNGDDPRLATTTSNTRSSAVFTTAAAVPSSRLRPSTTGVVRPSLDRTATLATRRPQTSKAIIR